MHQKESEPSLEFGIFADELETGPRGVVAGWFVPVITAPYCAAVAKFDRRAAT